MKGDKVIPEAIPTAIVSLRTRQSKNFKSTNDNVGCAHKYRSTMGNGYLTNPGHSRDFGLSTAGAFQCTFTEKEVNIMSDVETFYKVHI